MSFSIDELQMLLIAVMNHTPADKSEDTKRRWADLSEKLMGLTKPVIDPDGLPDDVISDILNNLNKDNVNYLYDMPRDEAWDRYLTWNGMINWSAKLHRAHEAIYG